MAGAPETLATPALFAAILFLLAATSTAANPLGGSTPHFLGTISYATYLCHYPLWIVVKLLFVRDAASVSPVVIVAYLVTVLACSMLLHRYVERPAQRWIDGFGRQSTRSARALP